MATKGNNVVGLTLNYIKFGVKLSRAFCCHLLLKINIFDFLSKNGHFQRILKLLKMMIFLVVVNFICQIHDKCCLELIEMSKFFCSKNAQFLKKFRSVEEVFLV